MAKKDAVTLRAQLQNRSAIAIILAGLFVGSLFVDVVQFVRGAGFSDRAVSTTSLIPYDGRTWVAYKEPIVPMTVVVDASCAEDVCRTQELIAWLQYTIPTVQPVIVDAQSSEGAALVAQYGLAYTPSIVFDTAITRTQFFATAGPMFVARADAHILDLAALNLVPITHIVAPNAQEALTLESALDDAVDHTISVVGNFACPGCAAAHLSAVRAVEEGAAKHYAFTYRPASADDVRSARAMEAAYCADAQGDGIAYLSRLFATQTTWQRQTTDASFLVSAQRVGVEDVAAFTDCLESGAMTTTLNTVETQSALFGTAELPVVFVGDHALRADEILTEMLTQ